MENEGSRDDVHVAVAVEIRGARRERVVERREPQHLIVGRQLFLDHALEARDRDTRRRGSALHRSRRHKSRSDRTSPDRRRPRRRRWPEVFTQGRKMLASMTTSTSFQSFGLRCGGLRRGWAAPRPKAAHRARGRQVPGRHRAGSAAPRRPGTAPRAAAAAAASAADGATRISPPPGRRRSRVNILPLASSVTA